MKINKFLTFVYILFCQENEFWISSNEYSDFILIFCQKFIQDDVLVNNLMYNVENYFKVNTEISIFFYLFK